MPEWGKGRNSERMTKKRDERGGWRERKPGKERRLEREKDGENERKTARYLFKAFERKRRTHIQNAHETH